MGSVGRKLKLGSGSPFDWSSVFLVFVGFGDGAEVGGVVLASFPCESALWALMLVVVGVEMEECT